MEIIQRKVNDLIPYINNSRTHSEEQVNQIVASINEFGFTNPLLIDEKDNIIAVHGRLLASKKLKMEEVPCIVLSGLTEAQKKAYIIADNKMALNAGWDDELLKIELENLKELDFDLELTGFNVDELDVLFKEDEEITKNEKNDDYFYFEKEEIQKDIVENWKTYKNVNEYIKNIIDEATAKYQFNRLCQGYNDGYNISLLFNPHRLETDTIKSKNMFYGINNDEKYRKEYARYIVNVENKVVPANQYYKFIGIGNGGYQYVNEFPPYLARDIYKKYCKEGYKILNPCAGWGGRIIGLASCLFNDIEYVETDPQKETFSGLLKLKKFLKLGDNYKQYNLPFEKLQLKDNYFDFVFTSPPYFDTERYSKDENQSYMNKNNYEEWRDYFLYIMLDKIYCTMKKGAVCLLNVGKVRYPIDEDIIKYMKDKYNIVAKRIKDFKYGGTGIGSRTDEDGDGEPFIEFIK